MTRYRLRAVLLLLLVLNVTACTSWHSVSLDVISPAELIEEDQPDRVRVTGGRVLEREVVLPSVEGDQLVGADGFSMPLADILGLEVRGFSLGRTVLLLNPITLATALIIVMIVPCAIQEGDCFY